MTSRATRQKTYLTPYRRAHGRRARGIHAMLWEDLESQEVRFEALARSCPFANLSVLDVGCGRADLLAYLQGRGIAPARYRGIEALPWLVRAARRRRLENCTIVQADFLAQPEALHVGADVIVVSGSLNLLPSRQFFGSLAAIWAATPRFFAFNFLSSPALADAPYLHWHSAEKVLAFAQACAPAELRIEDGYEPGDCTIVMRKAPLRKQPVASPKPGNQPGAWS